MCPLTFGLNNPSPASKIKCEDHTIKKIEEKLLLPKIPTRLGRNGIIKKGGAIMVGHVIVWKYWWEKRTYTNPQKDFFADAFWVFIRRTVPAGDNLESNQARTTQCTAS